jgi:hypothetical protein
MACHNESRRPTHVLSSDCSGNLFIFQIPPDLVVKSQAIDIADVV